MSVGSAIIDGLLIGAASLAIAVSAKAQDLPESFHVCTKTACYLLPVSDLISPKPAKPKDIFVEGPILGVDRSSRKPVRPEREERRQALRLNDEVAILPNNRAFRKAMLDVRRFGSARSLLPQNVGSGTTTRFNPGRHAVNR